MQKGEKHYACRLKNVSKRINNTQILKNVNMEIQKGSVTALLGPNGAGKTSSIRIIMGLLTPQKGTVEVLGTDVITNPEKIRRTVGLLPQSDAGYKTLTARENIEFLIKLSGGKVGDHEDKLKELIQRLDLKNIIDQNFGTLSGGEQRAVGFIRALLTGSELLILDEPTTGLDLARASIMRKIIQEEVNAGKTVLMSSHVITDLEELAQNIIIMKHGKVEKSGTRSEIQNHYARGEKLEDAIVKAFLGNGDGEDVPLNIQTKNQSQKHGGIN